MQGGRGLIGVEAIHDFECSGLACYVLESDNAFTQVVQETPTPTQSFLMKCSSRQKYTSPSNMNNKHHNAILAKLMHGKLFVQQRDVPQVDLEQSHHWLQHASLRCETEVAICATQDQSMATNYICHTIYKQAINHLCQLCRKYNETILHITSGCDMLHSTKYMEQHNKVCTYLHWYILQDE
eukprot:5618008-Ditylum_brightwellii.AAC.1